MPVTEIALLRLKSPVITQEFRDVFTSAIQKQYKWYCAYCPAHRELCESLEEAHDDPKARIEAALKRDRQARAIHYWQGIEDPHVTCIVTNWTSAEEHYKWIGSDENKAAMGQLLEYFVEPPAGVELFHVDPALVPSVTEFPAEETREESMALTRWTVPGDKRKEVEEFVANSTLPGGSGWRIEKSDPETEGLILLSSQRTAQLSPSPQLNGAVKNVKILAFNRLV